MDASSVPRWSLSTDYASQTWIAEHLQYFISTQAIRGWTLKLPGEHNITAHDLRPIIRRLIAPHMENWTLQLGNTDTASTKHSEGGSKSSCRSRIWYAPYRRYQDLSVSRIYPFPQCSKFMQDCDLSTVYSSHQRVDQASIVK